MELKHFYTFILLTSILLFPFHAKAAEIDSSYFGINHIFDNQEVAKNLGFSIERLNLIWKNMQKMPYGELDQYTKEHIHNILDKNLSFGIQTFLLIERPPESICDDRCPYIEDLNAYEDFLSKILIEYKDKIVGIEIYNEPDREVHWPPEPNPRNYVDILKKTKEVRDLVAPNLLIILGGNSGPPDSRLGYTFLYDIFELGAYNYFDVFNYHHYTQNEAPDEGYGHPEYWHSIFQKVFSDYNVDKPIWVTEFGYATAGEPLNEVSSEYDQAKNIVKMYDLLLQTPKIEKFFLFELFDSETNSLKYGIMKNVLEPKPAFYAVKNFIKTISGSSFNRVISYSDPFVSHSEYIADNKNTHILWYKNKYVYPSPKNTNQAKSYKVSLKPFYENIELKNIEGENILPTVKGDIVEFEITNEPIYFIEIKANYKDEAINYILEKNIASGFSDGLFHPERYITRAELLKMAFRAFNKLPELDDTTIKLNSFSDIPDDHWVIPYVDIAKKEGIIQGNEDGNFYPDNKVSRYEAIKILVNTAKFVLEDIDLPYRDLDDQNPFYKYITTAYSLGMIPDSEFFLGDKYLFRGEMAEIISSI